MSSLALGKRLCGLLLALAWTASASANAIVLDQPDGSELILTEPASRLVVLSPHLAELAYAAGAGDSLLATVEYSDFPAEATRLPRVGDAFRLDIERIVALQPDLVIAWGSGNPQAAQEQIRSLGLPVWSVEIRDPGEIADVLQDMGKATGNLATAGPAAQRLRQRLQQLATRYQGVPVLDYFYQVDERPLFTINGDHLISKGLVLCGGHNIFDDQPGLAFQVAHESVIVANPHALFAPHPEETPDPLAAWRQWPGMQAVQSEALFLLPADEISRATPRWLDSLELACTLLHQLR